MPATVAAKTAAELPVVGAASGGVLGLGAPRHFAERPEAGAQLFGSTAVLELDQGVVYPTPLRAAAGAARTHAELAGTAGRPQLLLRATLAPRTDVNRALDRIYGTVVADLETALEARLAHVGLEIDVARDAAGSAKTSVRGTGAEHSRQGALA